MRAIGLKVVMMQDIYELSGSLGSETLEEGEVERRKRRGEEEKKRVERETGCQRERSPSLKSRSDSICAAPHERGS